MNLGISFYLEFITQSMWAWILLALLGKIRKDRRVFFWTANLIWMTFSFTLHMGMWDWISVSAGGDIRRTLRLVGMVVLIFVAGTAYDGKWIRFCILMVFSDLLMSFVIMGTAVLITAATGISLEAAMSYTPTSLMIIKLILFNILMILVIIIFRKPIRWFRELQIEQYRLAGILAVISFVPMLTPAVYMASTPLYRNDNISIVCFWLILLLAIGGSLYYYTYSENIRLSNQLSRRQIQLTNEHRMIIQEQQAMARKLRHDIKRHMNTLAWTEKEKDNSAQVSERLLSYRGRLQEMIDDLGTGDYSGLPEVDAMLFSLEKLCRQSGFLWDCRLRQADFSVFPPDIRRDIAFEMAYWGMFYVGESTGQTPETIKKLTLSGGINADRCLIKIHVSGIVDKVGSKELNQKTCGNIMNLMHSCGIEGDANATGDQGSAVLHLEWKMQ